MACGERFSFLLPAPCEGLGILCSGEDYEVARERVAEINRRLITAWNQIVAVENTNKAWPVTDKYRTEHDAWLGRYQGLGWQLIASRSDFEAVEQLARDGVCLLDQMLGDAETAYADASIQIPAEPYTPPSRLDQVTELGRSAVSVAVIAALGFVAFKVWDRYG